jgi:hypothetical protein
MPRARHITGITALLGDGSAFAKRILTHEQWVLRTRMTMPSEVSDRLMFLASSILAPARTPVLARRSLPARSTNTDTITQAYGQKGERGGLTNMTQAHAQRGERGRLASFQGSSVVWPNIILPYFGIWTVGKINNLEVGDSLSLERRVVSVSRWTCVTSTCSMAWLRELPLFICTQKAARQGHSGCQDVHLQAYKRTCDKKVTGRPQNCLKT